MGEAQVIGISLLVQVHRLESAIELGRFRVELFRQLIGNLVQLILRVHTEAAHDRGECDGWRVIASGWLVLELVRIRIVCFQLLQLASLELSRPRVLELVETLANGLFADVDGSGDLGRCPPEAMNFGSDQDGCSAQSVRPTAFGHPAAIHRLYEPNSGILDVLELVFELKLEAKLLDVERGGQRSEYCAPSVEFGYEIC